ncbi:hypothetical protein ACK3TF_001817 [Chlorella vulgaris]
MAARCPQEERNGRHSCTNGTNRGLNTGAAATHAASELALGVLTAPGPPQLTILGQLERNDKMRLGSTCSSLRQATLSWFPVIVKHMVVPGKTDVASFAAWLERHQTVLHLSMYVSYGLEEEEEDDDDDDDDDETFTDDFSETEDDHALWLTEDECNNSLTALPASLVTTLTVTSLLALPAAVSTLTGLTQLDLFERPVMQWDDALPARVCAHHLRPLAWLRQLSLADSDMGSNAKELLSLPALTGLRDLDLMRCGLKQLP